jgi:MarR family transcriptional regulator, organic hydroperoxide resistance regulator
VISDNGIILALQRTTHHTLHALGAALAGLDLTAAEINALANLADGRTRSVSRLSAETGTRATTLTGVLDRLERRGYLTRELDAADRRSFRLALTEAGRLAAAQVHAAVADLERTALAGLSADQIAGYHAVVTALQEFPRGACSAAGG